MESIITLSMLEWVAKTIGWLVALNYCYEILFPPKTLLTRYIDKHVTSPRRAGICELLRVLHYYHAFRFQYDIKSESDIEPVVDRVHNRIYRYTNGTDELEFEIIRVRNTYREL